MAAVTVVDRMMHKRIQDFTMDGVHVLVSGPGCLADVISLVESRGKTPERGSGGLRPQKLKQIVKLVYNYC